MKSWTTQALSFPNSFTKKILKKFEFEIMDGSGTPIYQLSFHEKIVKKFEFEVMDDPGTSIIFKKFEFESMDNPGTLPSQLTH